MNCLCNLTKMNLLKIYQKILQKSIYFLRLFEQHRNLIFLEKVWDWFQFIPIFDLSWNDRISQLNWYTFWLNLRYHRIQIKISLWMRMNYDNVFQCLNLVAHTTNQYLNYTFRILPKNYFSLFLNL